MNGTWPSRVALGLAAAVAAAGAGAASGAEKETPERTAAKWIIPAADKAIGRGLDYLAARQHPDGAIGSGGYRGNVAVVSLAAMAMMAGGSTPGRGPRGAQVGLCLDYVLANTQDSGYIIAPAFAQHGPMYGHGFATMFLAECYGMTPRPDIREKLSKAVKLIERTQNSEGGWRYDPRQMDGDISVTIAQVMALRAARNAGIHVPKLVIDRSTSYIKRSQNPDGGFRYQLTGGRESAFPRSAAAVVGLYSLGVYEGDELTKGLDYLMGFLPQQGVTRRGEAWYFYGHYYAALAMWQAGGERWAKWYPAIRDELLLRQQPDGSWDEPSVSKEFGTAMACLILQMPNNYLPIFQR